MELKSDFAFRPLPEIAEPQALLKSQAGSDWGDLEDLIGVWKGTGFNTIWRPNSAPGFDHFLELNRTIETIEFARIPGNIPNRGLLQGDINMFGVTYLQQIQDANSLAGLHMEPGIWANVPQTSNPAEPPTVVRMASIPHGTTIVAQGAAVPSSAQPPLIPPADITPFNIGNPKLKVQFGETDLSNPFPNSRTADLTGITQAMVDNPNSVLSDAIAGAIFLKMSVLDVATATTGLDGGGTSNTAFLVGGPSGPNAVASTVSSTFWIETLPGPGDSLIMQLQYTQTVLLDFNGLSWPHITVGTLIKQPAA